MTPCATVSCPGRSSTERDSSSSTRPLLALGSIEGTRLGTWECDIATGELLCNDRWFEMLGFDPEECGSFTIGKWEELCHPDDRNLANELMQSHFRGEIPYYSHEVRLRHTGGGWIWVLCRGQVIEQDADGAAIRMFGIHLDITEKKTFEEKLRDTSIRDPLTNLYNRRHLFEHLEVLMAERWREGTPVSLAMLDIDHFKSINDEHGHLAGDFVLREFSRAIEDEIRPYDLCGRYGGEEFVVVARDRRENAAGIVQRILDRVRALKLVFEGRTIGFTFSAGVADLDEIPEGKRTSEALIGVADRCLYAAKASGRNRINAAG